MSILAQVNKNNQEMIEEEEEEERLTLINGGSNNGSRKINENRKVMKMNVHHY